MLRAEFDHTLREAQVGNDAAFVRLWREANPMLIRYLRVAGVTDPRESARHAWASVIRDLTSFSGDEIAWRAWVLGLAREGVDEDAASRGRGPRTPRTSRAGGHRDDRSAVTQVEPVEQRGVNDTIVAIRDLPLGQGEILMLRLVGELPVATVADLVGTDVVAVHRSEDRAVERLGAERELLAWSLAAPALPEELADQRIALTAFRGRRVSSPAAGSTRVLAVRPGPNPGKPNTGNPNAGNPNAGNPNAGKPYAGKPPTVVRSRMAMLCIAAISASAMSAGALSAAAYVGVLPQPLQQVMHDAIGAPAATTPTHPGPSPSGQSSSGAVAPAPAPTTGAGGALPRGHTTRYGRRHSTTRHRDPPDPGGQGLLGQGPGAQDSIGQEPDGQAGAFQGPRKDAQVDRFWVEDPSGGQADSWSHPTSQGPSHQCSPGQTQCVAARLADDTRQRRPGIGEWRHRLASSLTGLA